MLLYLGGSEYDRYEWSQTMRGILAHKNKQNERKHSLHKQLFSNNI